MHKIFGIEWIFFHSHKFISGIINKLQHFILCGRQALDVVDEFVILRVFLLENVFHFCEDKSHVGHVSQVNIEKFKHILLNLNHFNFLGYF